MAPRPKIRPNRKPSVPPPVVVQFKVTLNNLRSKNLCMHHLMEAAANEITARFARPHVAKDGRADNEGTSVESAIEIDQVAD